MFEGGISFLPCVPALRPPPSALRTNRDWKGTSVPFLSVSQQHAASSFFACSRSIWWRWSEGEPWAVPPTVPLSNSAFTQYVMNNTRTCKRVAPITIQYTRGFLSPVHHLVGDFLRTKVLLCYCTLHELESPWSSPVPNPASQPTLSPRS